MGAAKSAMTVRSGNGTPYARSVDFLGTLGRIGERADAARPESI
ncbi:hypothetical protein K788_0007370 (plasmid) [Paraburkholderia caribensis MBA4]|uniref:Uncharacterized protein n=1 Tax=Paraburkholderia caribensis MBA4 TaxID=1323664 RepID=A0A0P0RRE4_9BURK|nr:hypothetical protein K788_0007370 [Paraburkholderia caribensis MBA4]